MRDCHGGHSGWQIVYRTGCSGIGPLWSLETGLQLDTLSEASQHMADRSVLSAEEFDCLPAANDWSCAT